MTRSKFIIDFDSTFTRLEALDLLTEIVLDGSPEKDDVLVQMQEITNLGMEGTIDFRTSLTRRLNLLRIHRDNIAVLTEQLKSHVFYFIYSQQTSL